MQCALSHHYAFTVLKLQSQQPESLQPAELAELHSCCHQLGKHRPVSVGGSKAAQRSKPADVGHHGPFFTEPKSYVRTQSPVEIHGGKSLEAVVCRWQTVLHTDQQAQAASQGLGFRLEESFCPAYTWKAAAAQPTSAGLHNQPAYASSQQSRCGL